MDGESLVFAKPYYSLGPDGALDLHHVPVPPEPVREDGAEGLPAFRFQKLREFVNGLGPEVKDFAQQVSRFQPLPAYNRANDRDWLLLKAILTHWIGEVEVPVVLVPIPLFQYVEKTASSAAYRARFAELDALPGVDVHDPLPDFHCYSARERRGFRFRRDCHLTRAAHRVLAESLARRLAPRVEAWRAK